MLAPIDQVPAVTPSFLQWGYQTGEPLKGYINRSDGLNGTLTENNILAETSGFFGQCEKNKVIGFMEDQPIQECGLKASNISQDFCTNTLSPLQNAIDFAISLDGSLVNLTQIVPGF